MNSLRYLLVVSLLSLAVLSTCGGGSKEDPVALCKQGCAKGADLCAADLGADPATIKALCESTCTSNAGSGMQCKNSSAMITAYKGCLNKTTCAEYTSCAQAIPPCEGGTGTGGASGTGTGGRSGSGSGGSSGTGTGGSSGTGTGGSGATGSCATLSACCAEITDATNRAQCQTAAAAAAPATCDAVISALRAQGYCN